MKYNDTDRKRSQDIFKKLFEVLDILTLSFGKMFDICTSSFNLNSVRHDSDTAPLQAFNNNIVSSMTYIIEIDGLTANQNEVATTFNTANELTIKRQSHDLRLNGLLNPWLSMLNLINNKNDLVKTYDCKIKDFINDIDRSVLLSWHGYLELFDTALKKLPSLQISLWRDIDGDISKNYKEGDEITWWYFSSCSSTVKVIKLFLGSVSALLMVEAKNGKAISAYSNFPQENEVVLPLDARLRVISDTLDDASLAVIYLHELTDENDQELTLSRANMDVATVVNPSVGE
ncbi:unnamed protein product [Rotaria sp. Silwood2]|nr:unnamed protein product [Rotaria sp. Silwood2]